MSQSEQSRKTRNAMRCGVFSVVSIIAALLVGCGGEERSDAVTDTPESATEAAAPEAAAPALDRSALRKRAAAVFGVLPAEASNPENAITPAKVFGKNVAIFAQEAAS